MLKNSILAGVTALGSLLVSLSAHADQPFPAQRPHLEAHARAYVAAVNEGGTGPDAFRRRHVLPAVADALPPGVFDQFFAQQRRVHGRLELIETRIIGPDALVGLMRDQAFGALHGVTLTLDPETGLVREFDPRPAPDWPSARPQESLDAAALGQRVRRLTEQACDAGIFSGAVLVAKGGTVLVEVACGLANRRYDVALTPESKINLGSMDKMFTAVAVMQLVEAGKLRLDSPISDYLDDSWLPTSVAQRITVRQLLTHTSGLGSFLGADYRAGPVTSFKQLTDYKRLVHGETPAFEPGSQFQYSETGMLLAGAIVEAISGDTYFDYVGRHIFGPSGMTDTGSFPLDAPVPGLAVGYAWTPETPWAWTENTLRYIYSGSPAGGGFSTVGDIYKFARALETGELVSPASLNLLMPSEAPNEYGAGFMISPNSHAGRIVGHEGFYRGVSSQLELYRRGGWIVVILGNQDWAAPPVGDAVRTLIAATG